MELVLEAGGEDLRVEGDVYEIYTEPDAFDAVRSALEARELTLGMAEITMLPQNTVPVEGKKAEQVLKLLEALDDHDDVTRAYANFDISEEQMAELTQG
jgi:transcriptional/translational regulatory protein YebC/TACO1